MFLNIEFYEPYEQVVDLSKGIAWPKWCVNGKMNIVHNCLDKYMGTTTEKQSALIWEGEDGKTRSLTYGELYLEVFAQIYGLSTVGLRYFNVFGPRQDPQSQYAAVVPIFITNLLKGETSTINGDGSFSRDFTYVDNVVHANMCAAEAKDPTQRVMNVACGDRISLNELYSAIQADTDSKIDAIHAPPRTGDWPKG